MYTIFFYIMTDVLCFVSVYRTLCVCVEDTHMIVVFTSVLSNINLIKIRLFFNLKYSNNMMKTKNIIIPVKIVFWIFRSLTIETCEKSIGTRYFTFNIVFHIFHIPYLIAALSIIFKKTIILYSRIIIFWHKYISSS